MKARDFVLQQEAKTNTKGEVCNRVSASSKSPPVPPLQLELRGIELLGGTLSLPCCHGCVLEGLKLSYPTYNREVLEMNPQGNCTFGNCGHSGVAKTLLSGDGNTLANSSLSRTNNG